MKLFVKKALRLRPEELDPIVKNTGSLGAGPVYLEGETVEPSPAEAKVLLERFPEHFEKKD